MKSTLFASVIALATSAASVPAGESNSLNSNTGNLLGTTFPKYFQPASTVEEVVPLLEKRDGLAKTLEENQQLALDHVSQLTGTPKSEIVLTSSVESSGGFTTFHFGRILEEKLVDNVAANVNVDSLGNIVSVGQSWTTNKETVKNETKITANDAVKAVTSALGLPFDENAVVENKVDGAQFFSGFDEKIVGDVKVSEKYYRTSNTLEKCYNVVLKLKDNHYTVFVGQESGKILGANNWVTSDSFINQNAKQKRSTLTKRADYKYNAVVFPQADLSEGRSITTNPADKTASRLGWHNTGAGDVGTTVGNNVQAQEFQDQNNPRRATKADFNFDYPIDEKKEAKTYWEAGLVNTFYVTNAIHDISYHYGFDEKSGNFQKDNFQNGGKGEDEIIANAQSSVLVNGQNTNNANFGTPPDGEHGEMNMYLFDVTTPGRDGDLDNNVIAHEIFHGVSNRLTGGPANVDCLSTTEAGGMGEGWSDVNAFFLTTKTSHTRNTDRSTGSYIINNAAGIRSKIYSTDMKKNSYTLEDVKKNFEVHDIGEIWATMLFEVMWNMIDKNGFTENLISDAKSGKGNTDFYQILLNGLKLQPCSPTFLTARDSIILADKNLGSKYSCEIWAAFAKRGLGFGATKDYKNNFDVPPSCTGKAPTSTPTEAVTPTLAATTTTEAILTTPPASKTAVTTTVAKTTTTLSKATTQKPQPTTSTCVHDKCLTGGFLQASCDSCVAKICAKDPYCCTTGWNKRCKRAVQTVCNQKC
ncbi:Fungalysin/Thermolysin Extracellular metalloproteinase 5 [Clydaea vesicula]|uniref:Extracellular metalloproteinase n=1 Tax=Clydaea vesicula TaxID=447962 RepID=A0AAD5TYS7_9FUNG|nr:Fungalysin/Thermolysin Extracellular metalloproteinase 5 [Clydaea vesicula]